MIFLRYEANIGVSVLLIHEATPAEYNGPIDKGPVLWYNETLLRSVVNVEHTVQYFFSQLHNRHG